MFSTDPVLGFLWVVSLAATWTDVPFDGHMWDVLEMILMFENYPRPNARC